jgi:hypothetical protein
MARPTVWRRTQAVGATPAHSQQVTLCTLAVGETLSRLRFQTDINSLSANLYVWASVPILQGVCVVPNDGSATPDLFTSPNNTHWIWWEGVALRNQPAQGLGTAKYVDSGPADGGYRDVHAMRKADAVHGSLVIYVLTGNPAEASLGLFVGVTASCLITLP